MAIGFDGPSGVGGVSGRGIFGHFRNLHYRLGRTVRTDGCPRFAQTVAVRGGVTFKGFKSTVKRRTGMIKLILIVILAVVVYKYIRKGT